MQLTSGAPTLHSPDPAPLAQVWRWLALLTLARLLLAALTPLAPQEAYYWSWSRFPALGYFDHPPLASYAIGLTTWALGSSTFAVKLAAVLWSVLWNVLLVRLVWEQFRDQRLVLAALLAINVTPLYGVLGTFPAPDAPMLAGWMGTLWALGRVQRTGQGRWWLWAGLFLGMACLGKYTGALLGPVTLAWLCLAPGQRHWLRRPEPYLAALLALLVFAPVLLWNAQNDWVSLAFQSTRRLGDLASHFKPRFFLVLLLTQGLLLTPYVYVLALRALVAQGRLAWARQLDEGVLLLWLSAALPLALFVAASFRGNVKMNWLIPVWWVLVVLGVRAVLAAPARLRRWRLGLASTGALTLLAVAVVLVPNLPLPQGLNTWSGWPQAAAEVNRLEDSLRAQGQRTFVFSPNYKISAMLWFYRQRPERTYAQGIVGQPALQFDYFPQPEDRLKGATGLLVLSDQIKPRLDVARDVQPFFDQVKLVKTLQVGDALAIRIYQCTGYQGKPALSTDDPAPAE